MNWLTTAFFIGFTSTIEGGLKAIGAGANRIYLSTTAGVVVKGRKRSYRVNETALKNNVQVVIALPRLGIKMKKLKENIIANYENEEITDF